MATKRITKADYLELEKKYEELKETYKEMKFMKEYYEKDYNKLSVEVLDLEGKVNLLEQKIEIKDKNNKRLVKQLENKCDEVQKLINENKELKKEIKVNAPVENVHKHNERNAGRKNKFTNDMIDFVVNLKNIGYTYLEIKQKFWEKFGKSISIGSISNIIKNNS